MNRTALTATSVAVLTLAAGCTSKHNDAIPDPKPRNVIRALDPQLNDQIFNGSLLMLIVGLVAAVAVAVFTMASRSRASWAGPAFFVSLVAMCIGGIGVWLTSMA